MHHVHALGKPLFDPLEVYYFARVLNGTYSYLDNGKPLEVYYFARVLNDGMFGVDGRMPLEVYYFARVLNKDNRMLCYKNL